MTVTDNAPESALTSRHPPPRWDRRAWSIAVGLAIVWSAARAGLDPTGLINEGGWVQVREFFAAAVDPDLSADFLRVTLDAILVTLGYALLGTALALTIGAAGGIVLSERFWRPLSGSSPVERAGWRSARFLFALPRSMHEVVFGLLLINVLGLNPLVAVLSIGIPFGAITAKVFSEMLDETPGQTDRALRAAGAGRLTALLHGVVPSAAGDLLSYSFYRFECAIRAAAVLGIVGAGGVGFQLDLSFRSLRYDQVWTLLWALVLVSGLADAWSSLVRRRIHSSAVEMHAAGGPRPLPRRDRILTATAALSIGMIPVAWWWLQIDLSSLWSDRTRDLAGGLLGDLWPPTLGPGGWSELLDDTADTVALAVLALAIAWPLASAVAFVARRAPERPDNWPKRVLATVGLGCRFILLIARAVPPPVWAVMAIFVFLPGLWPGAIALALYNLGVLGRLEAEVVENVEDAPGTALRSAGAGPIGVLAYATVPAVAGRFVALGLYRWEVAIRETVIVGVVGAAGLGRRLDELASSRDYQGVLATILALLAVTVAVDLVSASLRRVLR